jgi:ATP-binding protein involved in chromosome partitioning
MPISKDDLFAALSKVEDPELRRPLTSVGAVRKHSACDGHVALSFALASDDRGSRQTVRERADAAIRDLYAERGENLKALSIEFEAPGSTGGGATKVKAGSGGGHSPIPLGAAPEGRDTESGSGIPGVKHIIAVGAGKGGVGKSTISVNLAVALARQGHAVGLMDGDIYGPSVPTLLGLDGYDAIVRENMLQPFYLHGVKAMTIGKLVDADKPLIWRGPMAHGAFRQLVQQTEWGELDYLVIDLPPGTGDVPLTMTQLLKLTGAVIVCTPQKVAQDDAVRAAKMFQQLGVEVLGVVENMSYFMGDDGKEYDLFGRGGAEQMAQRLGLPYLGGVPINTALRKNSDAGDPSANFDPAKGDASGETLKRALERVAQALENQVAVASLKKSATAPKLTVS